MLVVLRLLSTAFQPAKQSGATTRADRFSAPAPEAQTEALHSKQQQTLFQLRLCLVPCAAFTLCSMASTIELASAFIEGAPPGEVCTPVMLDGLPPDYPSAFAAPLVTPSTLMK